MSYEIVFQTIVLEYNGKIYHFSRSGCNNDDYGRKAEAEEIIWSENFKIGSQASDCYIEEIEEE